MEVSFPERLYLLQLLISKVFRILRLEFEKKAFSLQPKTNKIVKTWVHLEFM